MLKVLIEYGPSLKIKNRQYLTPLTLAAKLGRYEVIIQIFLCIFISK